MRSSMRSGAAIASAISTCRRPRHGSGPRSRRPEKLNQLSCLLDHEFVIGARDTGITRDKFRRWRNNPAAPGFFWEQLFARQKAKLDVRSTILAALAVGLSVGAVIAQQDPVTTREDLM